MVTSRLGFTNVRSHVTLLTQLRTKGRGQSQNVEPKNTHLHQRYVVKSQKYRSYSKDLTFLRLIKASNVRISKVFENQAPEGNSTSVIFLVDQETILLSSAPR